MQHSATIEIKKKKTVVQKLYYLQYDNIVFGPLLNIYGNYLSI